MGQLNYFTDTESIGFYSPTVLIQYAIGEGDPVLHDVFKESVQSTLSLIEDICDNNIIGFNLAHDWFHICRTYGVFMELPKTKPPEIMDIFDVEKEDICHSKYCLKPQGALDLMLYGRSNELQATMNQKDIVIRRVPRLLSQMLVSELEERIEIPKLYFAKRDGNQAWKIKELHKGSSKEITPEEMADPEKFNLQIDPDFVNLRLGFHPSTGLKPICKYLLGKDTDEDVHDCKRPTEYSWFPCSGEWLPVAVEHIMAWQDNQRKRRYAENDVYYTRDLFKYFNSPYHAIGDLDSMLACSVGAIHWRGYSVDTEKAKSQMAEQESIVKSCSSEVNFNSPKQVLSYIHESCGIIEKEIIRDTKKETMDSLTESDNEELARRAKLVLKGRYADKKLDLLKKVIIAGRLYVTFKVTGTKSNRMSGGSFTKGRGGSINPQGIKGGEEIRTIFPLADNGMVLDGGDFDGFEVTIFAAVANDPLLNEDLGLGKSIHALWGASIYDMDYEYINSTSKIPDNEPEGYYKRSKKSFFAYLYDAYIRKLAAVLELSEEETHDGIQRFMGRYKSIPEEREKTYNEFGAMSQPVEFGPINWKEPKQYAESLLGFKRWFTLEFKIIKALFDLAQDPTDEMKKLGRFKVNRRDRTQSGSGALQSALFGSAFTLNGSVIRAALNHKIQSTGGELTKRLQGEIWELQPKGIHEWKVVPLNIHDEVLSPVKPELQEELKQVVTTFIEQYKSVVPLLGMTWKQNLKSWGG